MTTSVQLYHQNADIEPENGESVVVGPDSARRDCASLLVVGHNIRVRLSIKELRAALDIAERHQEATRP